MSLPLWSLLIATLMVYASKIPLNIITLRHERYDNHYLRLQHLKQQGIGHRAWASHQNMIEAYPMFAAGILVATVIGNQPMVANFCAVVFLVARVLFQVCYLADWSTARSISWAFGFGATLVLLVTPLL